MPCRFFLRCGEADVPSKMNLTIPCTVDKAKRVLGYQPKIGLREGMRRSVLCCENGIAI